MVSCLSCREQCFGAGYTYHCCSRPLAAFLLLPPYNSKTCVGWVSLLPNCIPCGAYTTNSLTARNSLSSLCIGRFGEFLLWATHLGPFPYNEPRGTINFGTRFTSRQSRFLADLIREFQKASICQQLLTVNFAILSPSTTGTGTLRQR